MKRKKERAAPSGRPETSILISMYEEDLRSLDEHVAELKKRGYLQQTRSALIRYALSCLYADEILFPKEDA